MTRKLTQKRARKLFTLRRKWVEREFKKRIKGQRISNINKMKIKQGLWREAVRRIK